MLKAISLYEPYASAMALGDKTIETRSWPTKFRGDLAICAGRRQMTPDEACAAKYMVIDPHYGMCVCVVEIYDCVPSDHVGELDPRERALGDYSSGRFAWLTKNLRKLHTPVPVVGHQGLWTLNPVLESFILKSTLQPLEDGWKRKAYVTA
jgi:hypothetical protein